MGKPKVQTGEKVHKQIKPTEVRTVEDPYSKAERLYKQKVDLYYRGK
jgi:hypothetical protein